MAKKKNQTSPSQKYYLHIIITLAMLLVAVTAWALHERQAGELPYPTTSRLAHIDGNDAVAQVANFYKQYLADASNATFQGRLVSTYGSQNLAFYDNYYQHGFDPITCSTTLPTSVSASLASTGPVAAITAHATYPDHTTANITVRVILTDRLEIDSITCPAPMGNLPPTTS
jgi:hypothetical protein